MLSYQKNNLLSLLAQFRVKLYQDFNGSEYPRIIKGLTPENYNIIDRNLTSIEKQIKKL
jgi:hypothetical protein